MPQTDTRPARRADAQRSIEKILDAATSCLSRNRDASVTEIAQAAGVGRVTVYGHFPSREALVEAALVRVLARGDDRLRGLDLAGDPQTALRNLIESSWMLIAQSGAIVEAAQQSLGPARVEELHATHAERLDDLIRRGQAAEVFRTDLPANWLASVAHQVLKGAALEVLQGRFNADDASRYVTATILSVFSR